MSDQRECSQDDDNRAGVASVEEKQQREFLIALNALSDRDLDTCEGNVLTIQHDAIKFRSCDVLQKLKVIVDLGSSMREGPNLSGTRWGFE